jgi:hypothetical protein
MASADTLLVFTAEMNQPPATAPATLDWVNYHPVLDFDTGTDEYAIFTGVMPQSYSDGTGVDVEVHYTMSSAVSTATCAWSVYFERLEAGADSTSDGWGPVTDMTADTVPATPAGKIAKHSVSVSKGTDMNAVIKGDLFRLRIMRDVSRDDGAGDAELHSVELRET